MYSDAMFLDPCLSPLLHSTIKRLADVSNQREDLLGLTLESKQMRTCTYVICINYLGTFNDYVDTILPFFAHRSIYLYEDIKEIIFGLPTHLLLYTYVVFELRLFILTRSKAKLL